MSKKELTDREEAMLAILKDTKTDLEIYIEQGDLEEDNWLERMPLARINQYLERIEDED